MVVLHPKTYLPRYNLYQLISQRAYHNQGTHRNGIQGQACVIAFWIKFLIILNSFISNFKVSSFKIRDKAECSRLKYEATVVMLLNLHSNAIQAIIARNFALNLSRDFLCNCNSSI